MQVFLRMSLAKIWLKMEDREHDVNIISYYMVMNEKLPLMIEEKLYAEQSYRDVIDDGRSSFTRKVEKTPSFIFVSWK